MSTLKTVPQKGFERDTVGRAFARDARLIERLVKHVIRTSADAESDLREILGNRFEEFVAVNGGDL